MPSDSVPGETRDPLRAIYEREQRRPRRSRLFSGVVTLLVLGAMALVVYYAYQLGLRAGAQGPVPLIKAEQQPYKVKPEEPGGMDVPNQDKLIYKEVKPAGSGAAALPAEHLMPPPEAPLPKPAPEPPVQPQQAEAAPPQAATAAAPPQAATAAAPPSASPASDAAATPPAASQQVAQGGGQEPPSPPAKSGSSSQPAAPPAAAVAPAKPAPSANSAVASKEKAPPRRGAGAGGEEWQVQLGAVRTAEEAQHEWARLQGKYADQLGQLSLNIQRVDLGEGKGVFFRIQGGPLPDRAQANALCDKLKALQVGCLAVKP